MAGHNKALSPNIHKSGLDLVFNAEFDYQTQPGLAIATNPLVFQQKGTDRGAVITEQLQGAGYWGQRGELQDVPSGTIRVGNQQTHSVLNFSQSIDISKNLWDDDIYDTVEMSVRNFARSARVSRDKHAFDQYNLGFTTVTSNDAVALFSNSHTTLDGTTVDNLETGVLSEANLNTAVISLMEQLTQDGTLGSYEPSFLLVPPALFKTATEVTKSELRSGTANNDLNYFSQVFPGMVVLQSPFLGASAGGTGSDTAWFIGSRGHSFCRWQRQGIDTTLVPWQNQRNNNYIYKGEYREVVAPISYEGLVGSNGTV